MGIEHVLIEDSFPHMVVLVTASSQEEAQSIGSVLVQEGLAACVNVVPQMVSIFTWKGAIENEKECLMIIKSRTELLDQLTQRVKTLHSYDVPEVIALDITAASDSYLKFLTDSLL